MKVAAIIKTTLSLPSGEGDGLGINRSKLPSWTGVAAAPADGVVDNNVSQK